MQERLIREMVKLRGGPAKLKVLCKEYDEQIEKISKERAELIHIRDLIVNLTKVEEEEDGSAPDSTE